MRTKKELKKQQQTRDLLLEFLLRNIDHPEWSHLKRIVNKLNDNIEKLKAMPNPLDYEFQDMRQNRIQAKKALKKVKAAREGKTYKTVQVDKKTWKEVLVNEE